jgi:SAM-dependent methyltransferase
MIKKILRKLIPGPTLTKWYLFSKYGPADLIDFILGRREELVPPKRKIFIGGPHFKEIGDEFFKYFTQLGGLTPSFRVLDIGCGIGRMARPLTAFLSSGGGSYEGLDIDGDGIAWCNKHISPKYPVFHFQRADIYNKYYNPGGKYRAVDYPFPFPDGSFDFAFAISVFTHMYLPDIGNYIAEAARVMKRGGSCFFTFFLINSESLSLISIKKSTIDFQQFEDFWVMDKHTPERSIGFSEERIFSLFEKNGLKIEGKPHYGNWCGRDNFLSYQDIIIAKKK